MYLRTGVEMSADLSPAPAAKCTDFAKYTDNVANPDDGEEFGAA
jgi:hypothetical protein